MDTRQKLFFDMEFTGLHKDTTIVSIGIVDSYDNTFYAEFTNYDKDQVENDKFLKEQVIDNLYLTEPFTKENVYGSGKHITCKGDSKFIREQLEKWFATYGDVEMWSDCLAYDWVLFNHIFGNAFSIPKNVYYIPFDICTVFKLKGIDPDISREAFIDYSVEGEKHNALYDAKAIKACYCKLRDL